MTTHVSVRYTIAQDARCAATVEGLDPFDMPSKEALDLLQAELEEVARQFRARRRENLIAERLSRRILREQNASAKAFQEAEELVSRDMEVFAWL